ncbi:MAG: RDD family protein [Epsilonproteobacteria bacterium]|nr:RDD family protein [Campylobacterota bacterium]
MTLQNASILKLTIRFFGYFISLITLIGFFIPLLRKDNRSLHDLISGTAVIREE